MYEIEMADPTFSRTGDELSVRLTRFVLRDGDAFAIYYVAYSTNANELAVLVSLGEWSEGSDPAQRAAFYFRARATADAYEVMISDALWSVWSDVELARSCPGTPRSPTHGKTPPWRCSTRRLRRTVR